MISEKYSALAEQFYKAQKADFDKILPSKSYFLIRDLPVTLSCKIFLPEIPHILLQQKNNGLWANSTRATYDVLSALKHVNSLGNLASNEKMKNLKDTIGSRYDYDSLVIKLKILGQTSSSDIAEINKLLEDMRKLQSEDGSWEDTVVATVHYLERLVNLGLPLDDGSVKKAALFLTEQLDTNWRRLKNYGKTRGLGRNDLSVKSRALEFEAAKKYKPEFDPASICFKRLGIMQTSLCLKLLLQLGYEHDEPVKSALDNTYAIYKKYNSLCYFKIKNRLVAEQKKMPKVRYRLDP
jgi:hypothetical protein